MTGTPDRSPIPAERLVEYWAAKIASVTAELAAAYARAAQEEGLTQDVVADRLGRDKAQISRILRGQRNLTVKTLSEVALAMECELRVILTRFKDIAAPNYRHELPTASIFGRDVSTSPKTETRSAAQYREITTTLNDAA